MGERIPQAVQDGFLKFFGIERKAETGPQEWLEGFIAFVSKAKVSIRAILHDDEVFVLGKALRGEEIPDSWGEVQRQMDLENQQTAPPQPESTKR